MEMIIDFPGGARVDAHFDSYTIHTDQPIQAGGEASAPTPFATFLAALGTCAGIYVLGFCRRRGIPTEGLRLVQRVEAEPSTGMVRTVRLDIELPDGFPEQYRAAVIRAAEHCAVKKHLEHPPACTRSSRWASGVAKPPPNFDCSYGARLRVPYEQDVGYTCPCLRVYRKYFSKASLAQCACGPGMMNSRWRAPSIWSPRMSMPMPPVSMMQ